MKKQFLQILLIASFSAYAGVANAQDEQPERNAPKIECILEKATPAIVAVEAPVLVSSLFILATAEVIAPAVVTFNVPAYPASGSYTSSGQGEVGYSPISLNSRLSARRC